jgi:hypothetical protein
MTKGAWSNAGRYVSGGPAGRHPGDSKAQRGPAGGLNLWDLVMGRTGRSDNAGERPWGRGPAGRGPGKQGHLRHGK